MSVSGKITIYNTLTRKKEEFRSQNPSEVKMYTCGVTVYDDCHIGHGRSLYVFEIMRRYLKYKGFKVLFVRNITDVDDKIINKANQMVQTGKISLKDAFEKVRKTYIDSYYDDLKMLNLPSADIEPLATENILQMQEYIQRLIQKDFAYVVEGNVYFSVRKLDSYGKLSGKKIDDLLSSVRIEPDSFKKDSLDFALWKKAKQDEPCWDSPWGPGRPGWHIECSVMSQKYLNTETLDIHGGGRDLIFPHHENECAQSEALTGKTFANYWIHHGLLTINGQKMAKSLGNFVTLKDILSRYPSDILKIFYLQACYSTPIDFSWERMEDAKKAYERINILVGKFKDLFKADIESEEAAGCQDIEQFKQEFIEAMDDDFNTPKGLAALFDLVSKCNKLLEEGESKIKELRYAKQVIEEITGILGFTFAGNKASSMAEEEIEKNIKFRLEFKIAKNFKEADRIREELAVKGIILEDTKDGTKWRRTF